MLRPLTAIHYYNRPKIWFIICNRELNFKSWSMTLYKNMLRCYLLKSKTNTDSFLDINDSFERKSYGFITVITFKKLIISCHFSKSNYVSLEFLSNWAKVIKICEPWELIRVLFMTRPIWGCTQSWNGWEDSQRCKKNLIS